MNHECELPRTQYIGRGDETEALYAAESKLSKDLQAAAKELAKVLGHEPTAYWRLSMASAVLALLNNTQTEPAVAACVSFLREHGIAVPPGQGTPVALLNGRCQRIVTVLDDRVSVLFKETIR